MFKALNLWLPGYLCRPRRPAVAGPTHLLLAVCDHFEPFHLAQRPEAMRRLDFWGEGFPKLVRQFRDADGVGPRHTFFYPVEQYDPEVLDRLAGLCRETGAEVEIHLHHDGDTEASLREKLERGKADLRRHGLLSRDGSGRVRYGFVHGDWALANSHPTGRHCGVNHELAVLQETGCYADFTMPSMPSPTQSRRVNQIYHAQDTGQPRAHDGGVRARVREGQPGQVAGLLLVQGPLGFNWAWRKFGVLPRLESGDLTAANPPQPSRFEVWQRLGIHVAGRPEWVFVKLHTHGAIPPNNAMLLGEPMRRFHEFLAGFGREHPDCRVHYVTARELANIVCAAEEGCSGDPGQYRDRRYQREALA
jgi:hypothetical protein